MTAILPIDEIIENGIVFNLFSEAPMYDIRAEVRAALYEADIFGLQQGAIVDDEQLLATLSQHLAHHDIEELRRILQEQRTRRRFT
jgi:hypothetical protein